LRAATLADVARRRARRTRVRWFGGTVAIAAAAALVLVAVSSRMPVPAAIASANARNTSARDQSAAGKLAAARALSELEAIDAASRELQSALAERPADQQLRAFLSSVTAQRDELQRRIRDAST
jgi:vacuolar-type H+-ATPase catalytic subunit A/Vma1